MPLHPDWIQFATAQLWQGTVFGLLCALFVVFFPGPARLRHFAGCLALLRFFLPSVLVADLFGGVSLSLKSGILSTMGLGDFWLPAFIVGDKASGAVGIGSAAWLWSSLYWTWAVGAVFLLAVRIATLVRALRAAGRQAKPFSESQNLRLRRLEAMLGLKPGGVRGYAVGETGWLGVIGIFRSRILVPEGLFLALEDKELDSVLLHELAHVERHDNLLRLLQAVAVSLLWFHPLAWWLNRRLHWESEKACDETVLRLTGANRPYAEGLLKTMRYALGLSLPGVSGMSRIGLHARVRDILNHKKRKDSPVKNAFLISTLVSFLGLSTLLATSAPNTEPPQLTGEVLKLSEIDQAPVPIARVKPAYPADCRKANVTGEVVVAFIVNREGHVVDPTSVKATDSRFVQPALDAVKQWSFRPGMKNQKPVNTRIQVPIVYSITKG